MATIGSVEFLEPGATDPSAPGAVRADGPHAPWPSGRTWPVRLPPRIAAALAVPLLGGAAGLAVAAPFRAVYIATTRGTSGQDGSFQLDGWGRYGSPGRNLDFFGHADRYGILLVAAAAVLVLSALTSLAVALQCRRAPWPGVALGAARTAALVCAGGLGCLAAVGRMRATTEYDALVTAISPGPFGARPSITVVGGGFVELTAAAAAAALAGGLVTLLGRPGRARHADGATPEPGDGAPPTHLAADAADAADTDAGDARRAPDDDLWLGEEELLGG